MLNKVQINDKIYRNKTWLEYVVLNLLVFIALTLVMQLWRANIFKYPLAFGGDATQVIYVFEQLKEGGLFGFSDRVSYPYYAYTSDFPTLGLISKSCRWLLLCLTNNSVFTINFIYLSGFFLATTSAFYVLRKLGVSSAVSMLIALLYAFLPYHFLRGIWHLAYSNYWPIPLFIYYCLAYMKGEPGYYKGEKGWINRENVTHIVLLVILGGHCIYYTYFSCFFMCMVVIYCIIRKENRKRLKELFFDIAIMLSIVALTLVPYLIGVFRYGSNTEVANRQSSEIDMFGLKIGQLLLPIDGHRISLLDQIGDKYREMPLTTENQMSALGILFSIGFVILIIELVREKHADRDIYVSALFNLGTLLLATIGGFASVIALFFTKIRCYNRLSVFIAFLCAIALAKTVDRYICKNRILYWGACILLLGIGLYDQTSANYIPSYNVVSERWDNDAEFIGCIEDMEHVDAQIYQMPYVTYPEAGKINKMYGYDPAIGYLHSDTLAWSYGCYTGRDGDLWNKFVSTLPLEEQIQNIYLNGFDGIYLDSNAYMEDELKEILQDLEYITNTKPIVSNNKRLYYFTLKNYIVESNREEDVLSAKTYWDFHDGFYSVERSGSDFWVWSRGDGKITLFNGTEESILLKVSANITTLKDEGTYLLSVETSEDVFDFTIKAGENNTISFPVILEPGENNIEVISDIPSVKLEADTRDLSFCIRDFSYDCFAEINSSSTAYYDFGDNDVLTDLYIESGLFTTENNYAWTDGNVLELNCDLEEDKTIHCTIETEYVYNGEQKIVIIVDDMEVFNEVVRQGQNIEFNFESANDGYTNIKVMIPNAISPQALGESNDDRVLGIAIQGIRFSNN